MAQVRIAEPAVHSVSHEQPTSQEGLWWRFSATDHTSEAGSLSKLRVKIQVVPHSKHAALRCIDQSTDDADEKNH